MKIKQRPVQGINWTGYFMAKRHPETGGVIYEIRMLWAWLREERRRKHKEQRKPVAGEILIWYRS